MNCNWTGRWAALLLAGAALTPLAARSQDRPYFITYSHQMEESGALEVSFNPVVGLPRAAPNFSASWVEFEYGVTGWWTSEFYLDGQATDGQSAIFTGYRWENRFRPIMGDHWINPVLYIEFENLNGADKTLKEVVGFDSTEDAAVLNSEARRERNREIETKLILGSNFKGWNVSENFIVEKNLGGGPGEFGYAVGVARPLALAASPRPCSFCRENFMLGVELYGGLGDWNWFTLSGTAHYLAPVVAWNLPSGVTLRFSPGFGLTGQSHRALVRFGVSYEFSSFGPRLQRLFR